MGRNVAQVGRRELEAHRRFLNGVTASIPIYRALDSAGNKEWMVDVYLGPLTTDPEINILRDVIIAPYAKELVTDINQPITLTRSHQGKWTVVGREKIMVAGSQASDGSILEPTFHSIEYNLAALGLTFIADVDYVLQKFQATPTTKYRSAPGQKYQQIDGFNAFGKQVVGPAAPVAPPLLVPTATVKTTTRHTVLKMAKYGPKGDPEAMDWGAPGSIYRPARQKIVELIA